MGKNRWETDDNQFNKSMTFPQGIRLNFHDPDRIGDVYVVVFKTDQINRKTAHHAILIDVAGSSDDMTLEGVLFHMTANTTTQVVKFRAEDDPWPKNYFYEIVCIGKLIPTQPNPQHWAIDLHTKVFRFYWDFTDQMTKDKWASSNNCQTFARALLNEFDLQWPNELPYTSDECLPIIIDVAIQIISIKASKQKKYEEVLKKNHNQQ